VTGLYLASVGAESPIHDESGMVRDGFEHLPGGSDLLPVAFDSRLDAIPQLCPPRPGKAHTPETRVRTLFASDALVLTQALTVCGWAMGGGETPGALAELSERFTGESQGGPR
jgi:hypothetical protein